MREFRCLIVFCATICAFQVAYWDIVALYTLKNDHLAPYGGILEE
jgi:hypothetical protein